MIKEVPDYDNAKGYADAWGFRLGSQIANLIDYIRDEFRVKYGCDYRLRRTGKNKFIVLPGTNINGTPATCELCYVVAASLSGKFKTTVTRPDGKPDTDPEWTQRIVAYIMEPKDEQ